MKPMMTCISNVEAFLKKAGSTENIVWSFKLDGVRVTAEVHEDGTVKYYSRTLKEYYNFECFNGGMRSLAKGLSHWSGYPVMIDGEVKAKTGNFSKVMTQVRRLKDVDSSVFQFCVFDFIHDKPLAIRLHLLSMAVGELNGSSPNISFVGHYKSGTYFESVASVKKLAEKAVRMGYEGVVIKVCNGIYEHKRSALWCKVKMEETLDLEVVGYEMGCGKHEGKVGALTCKYGDSVVSVGTGFDDEERVEFLTNTPKIIEVKYQEKTKDSLRFPVYVRAREDKGVKDAKA
jgi:DNA ligase-1